MKKKEIYIDPRFFKSQSEGVDKLFKRAYNTIKITDMKKKVNY